MTEYTYQVKHPVLTFGADALGRFGLFADMLGLLQSRPRYASRRELTVDQSTEESRPYNGLNRDFVFGLCEEESRLPWSICSDMEGTSMSYPGAS